MRTTRTRRRRGARPLARRARSGGTRGRACGCTHARRRPRRRPCTRGRRRDRGAGSRRRRRGHRRRRPLREQHREDRRRRRRHPRDLRSDRRKHGHAGGDGEGRRLRGRLPCGRVGVRSRGHVGRRRGDGSGRRRRRVGCGRRRRRRRRAGRSIGDGHRLGRRGRVVGRRRRIRRGRRWVGRCRLRGVRGRRGLRICGCGHSRVCGRGRSRRRISGCDRGRVGRHGRGRIDRRGRGRRRSRSRGRRGRSRRRRRRGRREELQRIEIPLRIGRAPDAEVDVRDRELRDAARADGADDHALRDDGVPRDHDRAEMRQRDGEPVRRVDRDRQPARRHRACERDDAARRSEDGRARRSPDVDATVLAARVRVRGIEGESLEHRPGDRPGPCAGRGYPQDEQQHERSESPHAFTTFVVRSVNESGTVAAAPAVVKSDYSVPR